MGYAPDWQESITFLPVDFASKAIIDISLYHPEVSAVYHLDYPDGIIWPDLIEWLQQYGYIINICSYQEWRKRLSSIGSDNALFPFLPLYLAEEDLPLTPKTNIQRTAEVLHEMGLPFPELNDQLLQTYLDYLCDTAKDLIDANNEVISILKDIDISHQLALQTAKL